MTAKANRKPKNVVNINTRTAERTKNEKDYILTYSDYSESATGFGVQMRAVLPYLRRKYNVLEIAIGANPQTMMAESKRGRAIIATCNEFGQPINGEYYGQTVVDSLLKGFYGQGGTIKACFFNHDPMALSIVAPVIKQYPIPILYWCLHDNNYVQANTLCQLSMADEIIYQTEYARRIITDHAPFLTGDVIYPAIDMGDVPVPDPKTLLKHPEFQEKIRGKFVVLSVCKNHARKNIASILNAARILSLVVPRPEIVFLLQLLTPRGGDVASGSDVDEVSREVLDVDEYCRHIGLPEDMVIHMDQPLPRDVLFALYRTADVFLLPSCSEGFGMIFLECFHARLPIITTDYSASGEVVGSDRGWMLEDYQVVFYPRQKVFWAYVNPVEIAKGLAMLHSKWNSEELMSAVATMTASQQSWLHTYNPAAQGAAILEHIDRIVANTALYQNPVPTQTVL